MNFKDLYLTKLKNNFEIKITDFNFKLLNGLLATGYNLFKWNKRDNSSCIYCNHETHDESHMFYKCMMVNNLWKKLSNVFEIKVNLHMLITGINASTIQNQIISLLCLLIYNKFIIDCNNVCHESLYAYIRKKLQLYRSIYKCNCAKVYLSQIIDVI